MLIPLDIISDPVCPWCYIGKARLDQALEQAGDNPFDIQWRPYQLNPDMPDEGMDRKAYLEGKFGVERARSFYAEIEQTALASGLKVDFGAIRRTPNTIDAHRVIHWARAEGKQTAVVSALFRRYFERGEDIGDLRVLVSAAEEAGLDGALFARLLDGPSDVAEIREADTHYREMGVQGVPCFIIAGKYVVTGAQDVDVWRQVIDDVKAEMAS